VRIFARDEQAGQGSGDQHEKGPNHLCLACIEFLSGVENICKKEHSCVICKVLCKHFTIFYNTTLL
jgi:hypothetical protein